MRSGCGSRWSVLAAPQDDINATTVLQLAV